MSMSHLYYSQDRALFDIQCDYAWHRRFNTKEQIELLKECRASLATEIVETAVAFGQGVRVKEHRALCFVLPEGKMLKTLSALFYHFRPDGHILSDTQVLMWWNRSKAFGTKTQDAPEGVPIEGLVSYESDISIADLIESFDEGPIYFYGSGPYLVVTQPLSSQQARSLLEVKLKGA